MRRERSQPSTADPEPKREQNRERAPPEPGNRAVARAVGTDEGERLPHSVQEALAGSLGVEAPSARIHRGPDAVSAAEQLGARAFTVGDDIVLGGDVDVESPEGQRTLVHEAVHAVAAGGSADLAGALMDPFGPVEASAERVTEDVIAGRRAAAPLSAPKGAIQGQVDFGTQWLLSTLGYDDPEAMTDADRIQAIGKALDAGLAHYLKVGLITSLWRSFGNRVLEIGPANRKLWDASEDLGVQVYDLPALEEVRYKFGSDVRVATYGYLSDNLKRVEEERARLGLSGDVTGHGYRPEEDERALAEVQQVGSTLQALVQERTRLLTVPMREPIPFLVETFDPDRPPDTIDPENPARARWAETKAQWDKVTAEIERLSSQSPALFAAVHHGGAAETSSPFEDIREAAMKETVERLGELTTSDPAKARAALDATLNRLREKIIETSVMLQNADLDWQDLAPVQAQLFYGQTSGNSGIDWNFWFYRDIARDVLSDHSYEEFWIQLGLAALSAAAFVFAPLAGGVLGGVLFGVGAGTSILQAGMSWERYLDLATAEEASVATGTGVVAPGAADMALAQAVLDSVFAFFDVVPPAWKAIRGTPAARAWRGAGEAAGAARIARLATARGPEAARIIESAVADLGLDAAARKAGRTPHELVADLRRADPGSHALEALEVELTLRKVQAPTGSVSADVLRSGDSAAVLTSIARDGAARTLDRAGGWKALSRVLDPSSPAAGFLVSWRRQIYEDLETALGGTEFVRWTGSKVDITNDLDISILGSGAAAKREMALEFLASRTGVKRGVVGRVLHSAVFVDPRRMHLYDLIDDIGLRDRVAKLAAEREREMLWLRRLHLAKGTELEGAVRQQMDEALGPDVAARVAEERFVPLTPAQQEVLARKLDDLYDEFVQAQARGDQGRMAELADEVAGYQSQINLAGGEAYASGAGVRRFVTERDKIGEFVDALLDKVDVRFQELPEEALTALIDQLPMLTDASKGLMVAGSDEAVEASLRSVGKYGERIADIASLIDPRLTRLDPGVFDDLAQEFAELKRIVDEGRIPSGDLPATLEGLTRRARWALDDLEAVTTELMGRMRETLALHHVPSALGQLQDAVRTYANFLLVRDQLIYQLTAFTADSVSYYFLTLEQ